MAYAKYYKTAEVARLPRAVIVGGVGAVLLAFAFLTYSPPKVARQASLPSLTASTSLASSAVPAKVDQAVRLVYRNSVVPGGVQSGAELAAVMARDPVAAAHYANINVGALHSLRVEKSRMVHVSYRIGQQIFWTRNKVRLTLGETLLSDGEHLIRARCGNRIADDAQGPVLINEPAPEVLETAFVSADDLIDQEVRPAAFDRAVAQPQLASNETGSAAPAAQRFAFQPWSAPGPFAQPVGFVPSSPGGPLTFKPNAAPAAATPIAAAPAVVAAHGAPALLVEGVVIGSSAGDPLGNELAATDNADPVDPVSAFIEKPSLIGIPTSLSLSGSSAVVKSSASVPEPRGILLSVSALVALAWARRRRARAKQACLRR